MDYLTIYNTLDSTNKEAHRLLARGPVINGLTLLALQQTEGKGQLGRTWTAQKGKHLAMSIIFLPDHLPPEGLPMLSMKVNLGIIRALASLNPSILPSIKWPNDIFIDGKKLCGILMENSLSGSRVQHSIIGIGMNVNETQFPEDLPNATSLLLATGQEYELSGLAMLIRQNVLTAIQDESITWKQEYDDHLFGQGQRFSFEWNGTTIHASVTGVSDDGKLLLQLESGQVRSFSTHSLKWLI